MNTILIHTHRNEIDNNDRINPLPIVFTTWNPMNAFSSAPKAPFVNCAAELKKKSGIGTNPGTLYAMKLNNDHNFPPIHAEIYNGNPLIYPIDANKNTISTEVILLKKTGLAADPTVRALAPATTAPAPAPAAALFFVTDHAAPGAALSLSRPAAALFLTQSLIPILIQLDCDFV